VVRFRLMCTRMEMRPLASRINFFFFTLPYKAWRRISGCVKQIAIPREGIPRRIPDVKRLCHGDPQWLGAQVRQRKGWTAVCLLWIALGGAAYGFTLGLWQWGTVHPLYVAIKIPLLFLLTAVGNGILNGMLAQLLGLPLSFRESYAAILASFAIIALILGSLSPVIAFLVLNTPAMAGHGVRVGYSFTMVLHVSLIAFAGVMANLRLYGLLRHLAPSRAAAVRGLFAWLAGNLLLGSQLSWILRPFIGSPGLAVQFLRPHAFEGSFFEALWKSLSVLIDSQ